MSKKNFVLALVAAFSLAAFTPSLLAQASKASPEDKVKQAAEKVLKAQIDSVRKAGYLGLYELLIDGQIYYTDEKVSVLIAGNLFDTKSMTNVTGARLEKLSTIKFADLPVSQAIKQVRGNGKRVLATIEDPNCGYCKRLAAELLKLDDVTLYTFLYPLLSEDSDIKARQIWCASDKAKAWNDWMVANKEPVGKGDCDTSAIDRNIALSEKLNVRGTPTLFFADGSRIPGAMSLDAIEQKLNSVK
ncbi:thiol:disulfide interchange protein DsbC [Betaproteobacteria bacterium]|nr:thiol:disulfide interchange protein DsbC [Betaproteobacteria bacterium]